MSLKTQVMLVDDHAMLRHGMAMLINGEPDMEVFAEANDGGDAMTVLESEHHPDIVLVDLSLKTLSGFELINPSLTSTPPKILNFSPFLQNTLNNQ